MEDSFDIQMIWLCCNNKGKCPDDGIPKRFFRKEYKKGHITTCQSCNQKTLVPCEELKENDEDNTNAKN